MKSSKYPSDVEGVGVRGKENTWFGIVVLCQLEIFECMYERGNHHLPCTVPRYKSGEQEPKEFHVASANLPLTKRLDKWEPFASSVLDTGAQAG